MDSAQVGWAKTLCGILPYPHGALRTIHLPRYNSKLERPIGVLAALQEQNVATSARGRLARALSRVLGIELFE